MSETNIEKRRRTAPSFLLDHRTIPVTKFGPLLKGGRS